MAEQKPELKPKPAHCPNCDQSAIRIGNEITCETCDAIFVVNKKGESRVKEIGILDRLKSVEQKIDKLLPAEPEPKPEMELQPDDELTNDDDQDDDIFPR